MLLDIETRIGELLPPPEKAEEMGRRKGKVPGATKVLPEGMTSHRAQSSRAIAMHPEIVERIKAQANGGLP